MGTRGYGYAKPTNDAKKAAAAAKRKQLKTKRAIRVAHSVPRRD